MIQQMSRVRSIFVCLKNKYIFWLLFVFCLVNIMVLAIFVMNNSNTKLANNFEGTPRTGVFSGLAFQEYKVSEAKEIFLTVKPTQVNKVTEKKTAEVTDGKAHKLDTTVLNAKPVQLNVIPKKPTTICPTDLTIHSKDYQNEIAEGTLCRPHVPPESACRFTKKYFKRVPDIEKCKDQVEPSYELCKLRERKSKSPILKLKVKCDLSVCDTLKDIYIEWLDPVVGRMRKTRLPGTTRNTEVEKLVLTTAKKTLKNRFPFLFVNCTSRYNKKVVAQLLTFLPSLPLPTEESWSEKININVILIDSVSRAHFYRSLPKTVDYLRSVQNDPDFNAHVFDYELFQAVHGHTNECERALFDGVLFPGNVSTKIRDSTPVHLDVLFDIFKRIGYQTMFLDDLCWLGYYGLRDKYKTGTWKSLQEKLNNTAMDSLGFTDASCAILHRLNKNTGFFTTPNDQICFNGKHQHQYLFEYLARYLDAIRKTPRSKPLFSYTSTHVSHDSRGLRVQSMDTDLKNLFGTMATKENTISIIFADHGNTYTYYQVEEHEGRQEMYHPAMFVVLPKEVAKKLGDNVVANLRTNQYRLFNLFDVREGLIELARYDGKSTMNPKGMFGPISKNRTCDDLSMTASSMCLCQGWEVSVANSTARLALAEYAIGQLNNKIQEALLNSRRGSGKAQIGTRIVFGACQRLRVQEIGNVRTRKTRNGIRTTTMDAKVQTVNLLNQRELVTVQVSFDDKATISSAMQLVSYNRISSYGSYKTCADPGVNLKMCVCDRPGTETAHQSLYDVVGSGAKVTRLNKCVLGVHRSHKSSPVIVDVYEVANICDTQYFTATLEATVSGIPFSTKLPCTVKLAPRTIYFVASSQTTVERYPANSPVRWVIV